MVGRHVDAAEDGRAPDRRCFFHRVQERADSSPHPTGESSGAAFARSKRVIWSVVTLMRPRTAALPTAVAFSTACRSRGRYPSGDFGSGYAGLGCTCRCMSAENALLAGELTGRPAELRPAAVAGFGNRVSTARCNQQHGQICRCSVAVAVIGVHEQPEFPRAIWQT